MKWYWTPLLLVLAFANVQAQFSVDSFDIATYARPDLERRTAFVDPRFGVRNSFSKNQVRSDKKIENDFGLNLNVHLQTTRFSNTLRTQRFVSNNHRFSSALLNDTNDDNNSKSSENRMTLQYSLSRTISLKRFRKDQKFIEFDYDFSASNAYTRSKFQPNDNLFNTYTYGINGVGGVYLGKGRIELVNDAWHAITILEFLQTDGLLQKSISKENIQSFAEHVSEIKNLRNTDSRLETISEYEALCAYLVENKMVNSQDYRFFAVLLDAWQFESFVTRLSGKEFKYGLKPDIRLSYINDFQSRKDSYLYYALLGNIQYNHYKPMSDLWQFDYSGNLEFGISRIRTADFNGNIQNGKVSLLFSPSVSASLFYLPSQRTNFTASFRINYDHVTHPPNEDSFRTDGLFTSISGSYNYYVTPRLTWRIFGIFSLSNRSGYNTFWTYRNNSEVSMNLSYRFR